jgi:hypothetical protein
MNYIQAYQTIIIPYLNIDLSLERKEEKGQEIKFTPDYKASEPIFWRVFEELSKNDNSGLVSYDRLQERLISTGKFYAGDAVIMIEHMEKTGKIEQTEQFHLYKRRGEGNLASP